MGLLVGPERSHEVADVVGLLVGDDETPVVGKGSMLRRTPHVNPKDSSWSTPLSFDDQVKLVLGGERLIVHSPNKSSRPLRNPSSRHQQSIDGIFFP